MRIDLCNPNLNTTSGDTEHQTKLSCHEVVENPLSDLRFLSTPLRLGWRHGFLPYQERLNIRDSLLIRDPYIEDLVFRGRRFRQTVVTSVDELDSESLKEIFRQALAHLFPKGTFIQLDFSDQGTEIAKVRYFSLDTISIDYSDKSLNLCKEAMNQGILEEYVASVLNHELVHSHQFRGPPGSALNNFIRRLTQELNEGFHVTSSMTTTFSDHEINNLFLNNLYQLLYVLEENPGLVGNQNHLSFKSYLTNLLIQSWANKKIGDFSEREKQTLKAWLQPYDQLDIEREAHRVGTLTCPALGERKQDDPRLHFTVNYKKNDPEKGRVIQTFEDCFVPLPKTWSRKIGQFIHDFKTEHKVMSKVGLIGDGLANSMFVLDWLNFFEESHSPDCSTANQGFNLGIAALSTGSSVQWARSLFGSASKITDGRWAGVLGAGAGLLASVKVFFVDLGDDETTTAKMAWNGMDVLANSLLFGSSLFLGIEGGMMGRLAPLALTMTGAGLDITSKIGKSFC